MKILNLITIIGLYIITVQFVDIGKPINAQEKWDACFQDEDIGISVTSSSTILQMNNSFVINVLDFRQKKGL